MSYLNSQVNFHFREGVEIHMIHRKFWSHSEFPATILLEHSTDMFPHEVVPLILCKKRQKGMNCRFKMFSNYAKS